VDAGSMLASLNRPGAPSQRIPRDRERHCARDSPDLYGARARNALAANVRIGGYACVAVRRQ
jgi:hypothetical protein